MFKYANGVSCDVMAFLPSFIKYRPFDQLVVNETHTHTHTHTQSR